MLFIDVGHRGGERAAAEVVMVLMTFGEVLWGIPVAAVLEKIFKNR